MKFSLASRPCILTFNSWLLAGCKNSAGVAKNGLKMYGIADQQKAGKQGWDDSMRLFSIESHLHIFPNPPTTHIHSHTRTPHTHTHTHGREVLIKPLLYIRHGLTGQLNGVDPFVGQAGVEETTFELYLPYCCRSRSCGGSDMSVTWQSTITDTTSSPMQGLMSAESTQ